VNVPGWASLKTLVSVMAYHSSSVEVEASNTPRYAALTLHAVTSAHSSDDDAYYWPPITGPQMNFYAIAFTRSHSMITIGPPTIANGCYRMLGTADSTASRTIVPASIGQASS
jgi:hypothetical protein